MKRILSAVVLFLCCAQAQGQAFHVPAGYGTIQSAINAADNGDTIIVSTGTYQENINFLGKAVTVTSVNPDDPNVVAATIIDGSSPADPNHGSTVTFNHGESNNSIITGFTIRGGTGTWLVIAWDLHEPYWNRCGGGIVCYNMSAPTIIKNVITNNTAGEGGGIYVYGDPVDMYNPIDPPEHIRPVVSINTIIGNSAIVNHGYTPPNNGYTAAEHGDGGAIVCFQGVDADITGNHLQNNHADSYGGGIHLRQWSNGNISNNTVIGNTSLLGAGLHITYMSSPLIAGNKIKNNTCTGGGGGIYVYFYSNPTIKNNLIAGNEDWNSAGIGFYWSSQPYICNNIIVQNKGTGILCRNQDTAVIINNTISDNYSWHSSGGIRCMETASPVIENNIITSNQGGYGIYAGTDISANIRYNNVWGNAAGSYNGIVGDQTGINGNIAADPLFADAANYDYHLKSQGWRWNVSGWQYDSITSRCIDAGNPGCPLGGELMTIPVDPDHLRGRNLRIDMGGCGGTAESSMPPYNWGLLADMTNDGQVNTTDLSILAGKWLQTGLNIPCDLNRDHIINITDFTILADEWLKQTLWH